VRAQSVFISALLSATLLCLCAHPPSYAQARTLVANSIAAPGRETANDLTVVVGRSVLIDCSKPVERVAVGLGDLAEAIAVSRNEILVNGKAAGETSLIIWEQGGARQFFNVKVRPASNESHDRLEGIRRELDRELPGQPLNVVMESGTIFLSGTAKDLNSSNRAAAIASAAGKIVNLLNVQVPAPEPQILLKVIFASVDRTQSKSLGANLFSTGFGNVLGGASTGQFQPPGFVNPIPPNQAVNLSSELNLFAFLPGLNLGATIQALASKGLVQVLSEPNLLAQNGKQASFLAGGEYPYPVVQGSTGSVTGSSVTIQFKEYGVRLNFIPTITPRGTIRLQVAPEVSSLDFTNAVTVSGFQIPAIDVRKVNTEVELEERQSFAIGGLLDNRETETLSKIPYISNIPILGKLFQSISKNKSNTELIVIVTPEIVDPIKAGESLPKLNYPEKFLLPNSGIPMNTPDGKSPGYTPAPTPSTIPVEQLIQSMQSETPLIIDSNSSGGSGGGGSGSGASSGAGPPH
jgi:pilus assembly protein CpaC